MQNNALVKKRGFQLLCISAALAFLFVCGCTYGCVFWNVLHVPCPSCGMTRAFLQLLHGNVTMAFHYHPMFWSVPWFVCYVSGWRVFGKRPDGIITAFLLILYFVVYGIRLAQVYVK